MKKLTSKQIAAALKTIAAIPVVTAEFPAPIADNDYVFPADVTTDEEKAAFLKEMTAKDAELRKDGKPRYSTSMLKTAPVPAEGTKTKIYNVEERLSLLTIVGTRCKNFAASIYANNQEVFVNYWPARNRYTFASAKGEKGYVTDKGAFAFAAVSCDENGIVDADSIRFGNVRKDI